VTSRMVSDQAQGVESELDSEGDNPTEMSTIPIVPSSET
jgi:hypothetical protein